MCPDVTELQFRQPTGPEFSFPTGPISSDFQGAVDLMERPAAAQGCTNRRRDAWSTLGARL